MANDRDEGALEDVEEVEDAAGSDELDGDEVDDDGEEYDDADDLVVEEVDEVDEADEADEADEEPDRPGLMDRVQWMPVLLFQAAHAKQAIVTALAMGAAAVLAGRPAQEAGIVFLTVLVGQTILGWHNDIVDRERDAAHRTPGKPVADGRLEPGSLWYAIIFAGFLLVPLSVTTGIQAATFYGASVCVGLLGNVVLRTGFLSWVSWAASFALLPAYLSYGGWGGQAVGEPPEVAITVLAGLLGIGIHFMRAVWGLVADHEDGWTYLPLKLGLKLGATQLLALSTFYTVVIVVLLAVAGYRVGLSQ